MCTEEPSEYESDVPTEERHMYLETGGGYLVYRARMEYEPEFDQWFPLQYELIGVTEVENWETIEETLRSLGEETPIQALTEISPKDTK